MVPVLFSVASVQYKRVTGEKNNVSDVPVNVQIKSVLKGKQANLCGIRVQVCFLFFFLI